MGTEDLDANGKGRRGKKNTKTILTAAGLSAAVGMASGAAVLKFGIKKKENKEEHNSHGEENTSDNVLNQENPQTQQPEKPQQEQAQAATANDNVTTPQPTDSTNGTGENPSSTTNATSQDNIQQHPSDEDMVDPDMIAQQIVNSNEIDTDDLDVPDLLTVDGMDIAYGPDGSEFTVAMVRTSDGGQYMLADIDGDGVFSDVFDIDGNYIGSAEGNLTASDLQEAAIPTGEYMAYNGMEPAGEDPTKDIVATDAPSSVTTYEENLVADNGDTEIPDVEDVLAQLLGSDDDSLAEVAGREMVVDSESEDGDGSDDEDDDSENDDDDSDDDE